MSTTILFEISQIAVAGYSDGGTNEKYHGIGCHDINILPLIGRHVHFLYF